MLALLGCTAYNLGTGCGTSVLEMVAAFEKASGKVSSLFQPSFVIERQLSVYFFLFCAAEDVHF